MGKVIDVASWKDLLAELPDLNAHREWDFRGQSDAKWTLNPSISRHFDYLRDHLGVNTIAEQDLEFYMLQNFKKTARLYTERLPNESDDLEWLALMQHYGCPTRLLDFSFSPYIALFFAVSNGTTDFSLFIIPLEALETNWEKNKAIKICKKANCKATLTESVAAFEPKLVADRQLFQQSVFLCPTSIRTPVGKCILGKEFLDEVKKIRITKTLRRDFLRELNKMNINMATLFPGLQGYCESLKTLPLYSHHSLRQFNNP